MNRTSAIAFLGAALCIAAGSVHAQGSTTSDSTAATGSDRPATSTTSPRAQRHASKAAKHHDTAQPGNEAGVSTPNSTGSTSGAFTQGGSAVSTTPDVKQIKNARDGSPMRSSAASSPRR
jgi:hypothetical protein